MSFSKEFLAKLHEIESDYGSVAYSREGNEDLIELRKLAGVNKGVKKKNFGTSYDLNKITMENVRIRSRLNATEVGLIVKGNANWYKHFLDQDDYKFNELRSVAQVFNISVEDLCSKDHTKVDLSEIRRKISISKLDEEIKKQKITKKQLGELVGGGSNWYWRKKYKPLVLNRELESVAKLLNVDEDDLLGKLNGRSKLISNKAKGMSK